MTDDETYDAVLDEARRKAGIMRRTRDVDDGRPVRIAADAITGLAVLDDGSAIRLREELAVDGIEVVG